MKLRPTWSERLASPSGRLSAERSSSAAELTAPADRTTSFGRQHAAPRRPRDSRRRRSRLPSGGASAASTRAPVTQRRRSGCCSACGKRRGLGVHLAVVGVSGKASHGVAPCASQRSMSTPSGSEEGCSAGALQSRAHARRSPARRAPAETDRVGEWGGSVGSSPSAPRTLIQLLGRPVPRLQLVVGERPGRRDAVGMLRSRSKSSRAVAEQHRAVELRVAADIVVVAGVEGRAVGRRTRSPSGRKWPRWKIARGSRFAGRSGKLLAALEDHDARAGRGEAGGEGRAADARSR